MVGFAKGSTHPTRSLRLSRLRGRPDRIEDAIRVGENSIHSNAVNRGDAPTPALPRKRERERSQCNRTYFAGSRIET
jgi:hypothetical protein